MAKSKELSGFEQMMEDIRTGNHRGGVITLEGWANPELSKMKDNAMNARPNPSSKGSKPKPKRARLASGRDWDKENQESAESDMEISDSSRHDPVEPAKIREVFEKVNEAIKIGKGGTLTSNGWKFSWWKDHATDIPCSPSAISPSPGSKRTYATIKYYGGKKNLENAGSDSEIGDNDPRLARITDNCDQVRYRVNNFIDSGVMTVGEFQKAIGISDQQYVNFLMQKGEWTGRDSLAYKCAWKFFKKRELKGIEMPPLKAARQVTERPTEQVTKKPIEQAPKKSITKPTKKPAKKAAVQEDPEKYDVSDIYLDSESDGEVEIYETCDSMRRMVKIHLNKPDVAQASFLREVSKQFGNKPKKITVAQLHSFMEKDGAHAGSSSAFFYGAYVYFEKLRIKNGEEKSEFREDMEDIWMVRPFEKHAGFPRHGGRQSYIVPVGMELYDDEYGQPCRY